MTIQKVSANAPEVKPKQIDRKKIEDFSTSYANNVFLESSLWDLKLVFGQLDQSAGESNKELVLQHTAITLPWTQAKVLSYFLRIHLILHETRNGRLQIPEGVINPVAEEMSKELAANDASAEKAWKAARQLYLDFIAANPESAPKK